MIEFRIQQRLSACCVLNSEVGCPIRKSTDQRSFTTPRSLSQCSTSFIASCHQGIHQMLFSYFIKSKDLFAWLQRIGRSRQHIKYSYVPLGSLRCGAAIRHLSVARSFSLRRADIIWRLIDYHDALHAQNKTEEIVSDLTVLPAAVRSYIYLEP